jgi:branched-subunit amino acid ABC-type transport system permease component
MRTTIAPTDGPAQLIYAFEAVVIGGMGSFWGTFAGGTILGVAQTIGFRINPGWGILVGHLVFVAMLTVRPSGLFPKTVDQPSGVPRRGRPWPTLLRLHVLGFRATGGRGPETRP